MAATGFRHPAGLGSAGTGNRQDAGAFDRRLHPMVAMLSVAGMGLVPQLIRRVLGDQLPFPDAPAGEELSRLLVDVLFNGTRNLGEK